MTTTASDLDLASNDSVSRVSLCLCQCQQAGNTPDTSTSLLTFNHSQSHYSALLSFTDCVIGLACACLIAGRGSARVHSKICGVAIYQILEWSVWTALIRWWGCIDPSPTQWAVVTPHVRMAGLQATVAWFAFCISIQLINVQFQFQFTSICNANSNVKSNVSVSVSKVNMDWLTC